jgi:hypothetical protein
MYSELLSESVCYREGSYDEGDDAKIVANK